MTAHLADLEVQVQAMAGVRAHTPIITEEERGDPLTNDSLKS